MGHAVDPSATCCTWIVGCSNLRFWALEQRGKAGAVPGGQVHQGHRDPLEEIDLAAVTTWGRYGARWRATRRNSFIYAT